MGTSADCIFYYFLSVTGINSDGPIGFAFAK